MAESPPNVRLHLVSTAENVVLVREMLSGVAEAISLSGSDLNDIRTAVSEACNNVVLHAYTGLQGPLEIEVCIDQGALVVLVRDHGKGIPKQPDVPDDRAAGIGLHVIHTLARRVQFRAVSGGGTEVWMEFATPRAAALDPILEDDLELSALALPGSPTTMMVSLAPTNLARTVLPRMVSALAARAHFSTDRISDAQLLADALVAHAHVAVSGEHHLNIGVQVEPRDLELRIAPLGVGRAQRLIGDSALGSLGRVIEKLADRHVVASAGPYETLTLSLIDRH